MVALLLSACGSPDALRTKGAPVLTVVTGLWPLGQAASEIGLDNVHVVDVVPPGDDPETYTLDAAQRGEVRRAGLVLDVAGLDPSVAAAAIPAHTVTFSGADPYLWLNPYDMEAVGRRIRSALLRADPEAAPTFDANFPPYLAEVESLDEDYQHYLSACPLSTIVTVTNAFDILHPRYQVDVVALEPTPTSTVLPSRATVDQEVAVVRRVHARTVYNETWVPESALIPLQSETGVRIAPDTLDTLLNIPPGGFPKGVSSYFSAMESNLQIIADALECPNPEEEQ